MPNGADTLASALNELAVLGTERDREQLTALLDRLDADRLRVLVAGEAKRGKSTLVNALLGRDLLPSGVTPLTAVDDNRAVRRRRARTGEVPRWARGEALSGRAA